MTDFCAGVVVKAESRDRGSYPHCRLMGLTSATNKSAFISRAREEPLNAEVKAATIATVAIEGRIAVNNSDEMRRKLLAALRSRPAQITVDLSRVTYMDSSGLATLLEAARLARNQGTRLVLGGLSGQPRKLFEIGNLHSVFEFAPQETNA